MILEAIGIVTVGVTIITVASLRLVSALDKRERQDVGDDVEIRPFMDIANTSTWCPYCGDKARNVERYDNGLVKHKPRGPAVPRACADRHCAACEHKHVHVTCDTCGAAWFMDTADTVDRAP